MLDLDLLLVTSYVVMIPLYLALYVALRRVSQSFMTIALAFNMLGAALILGVNPGAAMLTLSDRYAAATTDAQRAIFLAAGQALITNWSGSAFVVGYLLGGIGVLITAAVMLRSRIFSKFIAYTGLVMGALMLVPASAGTVGLLLSLVSLAPTVIWLILIARRLFQLAAPQDADNVRCGAVDAGNMSHRRSKRFPNQEPTKIGGDRERKRICIRKEHPEQALC